MSADELQTFCDYATEVIRYQGWIVNADEELQPDLMEIHHRYEELKSEGPYGFSDCARMARSEWLRKRIERFIIKP